MVFGGRRHHGAGATYGRTNQLIIKWIRNYGKILGELIAKATVSHKRENVEILEMDELIHIRYVFVD